ncbi:MAG: DUF4169 family protein [Rhodobacteraceae bacterium]|nr:DUF4169 family protein [Paracoccaceae bacterium]MCP5340667.1 DUF4169 family protein [Paracoccaceae bacterium]
MAEIINFKTASKQLDRTKKRAQGTENAARSGRTKALRKLEEAARRKARDTLDAHRMEDPDA